MKTSEVLSKARALMNSGGKHWTKGMLIRRPNGNGLFSKNLNTETMYCSIGGLNAAAGVYQTMGNGHKIVNDAKRELAAAITGDDRYVTEAGRVGFTIEDCENVIVRFNDASATTWQAVQEVFKKAARAASRRK